MVCNTVVSNVKTGDLYILLNGIVFQNLRTLASGEVKPEIASKCFVINVPLSVLVSEFPCIKSMIYKLDLRIDNSNV